MRDVVRLLDGLPLAIALVAARVRLLSPAELLTRLADRLEMLAREGGVQARKSTLRAAIDWSWTLPAPWEQAALAQAAVFVGGFTLEAAEAVLELAPWPEAPPALDVGSRWWIRASGALGHQEGRGVSAAKNRASVCTSAFTSTRRRSSAPTMRRSRLCYPPHHRRWNRESSCSRRFPALHLSSRRGSCRRRRRIFWVDSHRQ